MITDRRTAIEAHAYAIWEREGRPDGKDLEHWLRAEAEVDVEQAGARALLEAPKPRQSVAKSKRQGRS